jgi:hypothetical protein
MATKPKTDEKKPKGKYGPEEFLVRPDEVARLRKAARDAGMDDDEFDQLLETARKRLRETGKLELPPKLKAAVDKKKAAPNLGVKARRRFLNRKGRQPEYVYGKKNPYFEGSAVEKLAAKLSGSSVTHRN